MKVIFLVYNKKNVYYVNIKSGKNVTGKENYEQYKTLIKLHGTGIGIVREIRKHTRETTKKVNNRNLIYRKMRFQSSKENIIYLKITMMTVAIPLRENKSYTRIPVCLII